MGSRLGKPNRNTALVELICQERKFSSIDAMITTAEIALEKFVEHADKEATGRYSPMESKASEYLKLYATIAMHISKFRYPMLKAIEHTRPDPLEGMTPEQRLEAMKQAVLMLEAQVKPEPK